jgi:DNA-binding XRE family transcriptional regulator
MPPASREPHGQIASSALTSCLPGSAILIVPTSENKQGFEAAMTESLKNVADLDIHEPTFMGSPGITGADLRAWRKKHDMTQDMLRMALQVGSRQTIISWEKSTKRLPRYVHLALIGLEHEEGGHQFMTGYRFTAAEARRARKKSSF